MQEILNDFTERVCEIISDCIYYVTLQHQQETECNNEDMINMNETTD
jgi:hypothetical protein